MPEDAESVEYELSPETIALLKRRKMKRNGEGCWLCGIILRDFEEHKTLTDYPKDHNNQGVFPVEGKLKHIELEKASNHPPGTREGPKPEPSKPKKSEGPKVK